MVSYASRPASSTHEDAIALDRVSATDREVSSSATTTPTVRPRRFGKTISSEAETWPEFFALLEQWALWHLQRWFHQCARRRAFQRWWKRAHLGPHLDTHLIPDLARLVESYA